MLLFLARATQVTNLEVLDPHAYLDNIDTLHASLAETKRALGIAPMREARNKNNGFIEFNIVLDGPMKKRCIVPSLDAKGNKGLWMEAAKGQIKEMKLR